MMPHAHIGRRLITTLTFGGLLAGCGASEATDNKAKVLHMPAVETEFTMEDCAAKQKQAELAECFEQLNAQNETRIQDRKQELKDVNAVREELSKDVAEGREELEDRLLEPER